MSDFLREVFEEDKATILSWRNHADVRRNMYTNHVITPDEHDRWFKTSRSDPRKRLLIYEKDGAAKGYVGFYNVNVSQRSGDWAFYSGDTQTRGIGSRMETLALEFAFRTLNLEKLSCEVLEFNQPVIRLHQKFGFQVEGTFRKHHLLEGKRHGVVRLALFKNEWERMAGATAPFKVGAQFSEVRSFSVDDIETFARLTGDRNPVHFDDEAAKRQGFQSRLVHGMLAASAISQLLATHLPGPGTIYQMQNLDFKAPIYPGQKITVEATVRSIVGDRIGLDTLITIAGTNDVAIAGFARVAYRK